MLKAHGRFYTRSMRKIATIGIVLFTSVYAVNGDLAEQKKRLEQELQNIPVPELPARAVEIIRSTPAPERSQAAIMAVETIVARYPAAATSVVAAVSKAAPESAAAAAATATRLAPAEAPQIEAAARPQQGRSARGNQERGNGNGNEQGTVGNEPNGNANGGVGLGPGPNKPGAPVEKRPPATVLPNGKPRHFPPTPPNRPVNPPRPHKYNRPGNT